MKATSVCSKTLVERDGVTLVVLPIGDARRDHPLGLLLSGRLARRAAEDGGRRRRRTSRDLLGLEARRLERILDDLGHLDDALRPAGTRQTGGVADVGRRTLRVRDLVEQRQRPPRQHRQIQLDGEARALTRAGCAALILELVSFSKASLVFSAVLKTSSSDGRSIDFWLFERSSR